MAKKDDNMKIRKARMMDKEDVYDMVCKMQETILDKERFNQVFWENMNHPFIYYIVAIEDDNVIGFASLHLQNLLHHLGVIGQIHEFCVKNEHLHQGVDHAMFENIKDRAIDLNCVQLVVSNHRKYKDVIAFYEAHEMVDEHDTCILNLQ